MLSRKFYAILIGLAVIRLWLMRLGSSFWTDEAGTLWVIQQGPAHALERALSWPGQTVLYSWLISHLYALVGPSEVILRIPSILAMALASYLLFRLAQDLINEEAGWLAVLVFVCLAPIGEAAADARPYAFSLCAILASTRFLVEWLRSHQPRYAIAYVLAAAFFIYMQPLHGTVLAVHAVYALTQSRRLPWLQIGLVLAGLAVVCIPEAWFVINTTKTSAAIMGSGRPAVESVIQDQADSVIFFCLLGGVVLAGLFAKLTAPEFTPIPRSSIALLIGFWLLPGFLLVFASFLINSNLYTARYVLPMTIGIALSTGYVIAGLRPFAARQTTAAVLCVLCIILYGSHRLFPVRFGNDFRGVVAEVRRLNESDHVPLAAASPYREGLQTQRLARIEKESFLYAPFEIYRPPSPLIRLPFDLTPETMPYVERIIETQLRPLHRFVLMPTNSPDIATFIMMRLAPHGFRLVSKKQIAKLELDEFVRQDNN
jgi:hypothetical protein